MVKRAVLFANGELADLAGLKLKPNDFLIGIDGGAKLIERLGLKPDIIIGDFDSYPKPKAKIVYKSSQDFTDTEWALNYCVKNNFKEIVLVGVLGRRLDHLLANIFLGTRFNLTIVEGKQTLYFITTRRLLAGKAGDLVSLIPLSDCSGVTTFGLKWRLRGDSLKFGNSRGVSNIMTGRKATVSLKKGRLLVVYNRV